jgi:chloramphenicol O-acetyltransferase type A
MFLIRFCIFKPRCRRQFAGMNTSIKHKIDVSNWKRSAHYHFFREFEQPFFGINTEVNCTKAYQYCKTYGVPFFLFYLHKALAAVNKVREFRYRIENGEVVEYQTINGSITVMRLDETFDFAYFDFSQRFEEFRRNAGEAIQSSKTTRGLRLEASATGLVHFSILKGIRFTSMQHAQSLRGADSVPKIVFGQLEIRNGQVFLPLSIHAHHALCDGLHAERVVRHFQYEMELAY